MNSMFKRVALVARHSKPQVVASLISLADFLTTHGLTVLVDRDSVSHADAGRYPLVDRADLGKLADLAIVLGGDGTMLSVARLLAPYNTPMVGVNQGRLGFMTDISLHEMFTTIEAILHGEFVPEDRILLNASVQRDGVEVASTLAFNDVVFSRGATGSMIEFEIFIDKQFVYSQRSDGLIVSTPTGSTAYSLAAAAQEQRQGVDDDGFAGAGFASEHGKAGGEIQFQGVNNDKVADGEREQHGVGSGLRSQNQSRRSPQCSLWRSIS